MSSRRKKNTERYNDALCVATGYIAAIDEAISDGKWYAFFGLTSDSKPVMVRVHKDTNKCSHTYDELTINEEYNRLCR